VNFPTTSWSLVLAAKREDGGVTRQAMERLCQAYWYPVYGYIRTRVGSADEAGDLTQEFFLRLLDKRRLDAIEAPRGRFRWFLQAAVKHFLANERDRQRAQKRGGGRPALSFDRERAEEAYRMEPPDPATPETIFERRWCLLLLDRAMDRLRRDYEASGKLALFQGLKPYLVGAGGAPSYRASAAKLGLSEGAVKVAVHRMRRKFAEALRAEIAETVAGESEIDGELQFLMATFQ
jgi:RNA polymerase sigma-70 factor (ECF subfamily)